MDLAAGDALVVPAFWLLHSQLVGDQAAALVLHLHPGADRVLAPGEGRPPGTDANVGETTTWLPCDGLPDRFRCF